LTSSRRIGGAHAYGEIGESFTDILEPGESVASSAVVSRHSGFRALRRHHGQAQPAAPAPRQGPAPTAPARGKPARPERERAWDERERAGRFVDLSEAI